MIALKVISEAKKPLTDEEFLDAYDAMRAKQSGPKFSLGCPKRWYGFLQDLLITAGFVIVLIIMGTGVVKWLQWVLKP